MEASYKSSPSDLAKGISSDLLNHLPILLFAIDNRCRIRWSNKFISQMLGYKLNEIKDMPGDFTALLNPADKDLFKQNVKNAFENRDKRFFGFNTTLHHKEHFSIHVLLKAYFFYNTKEDSSRPLLYFYVSNETEKILLHRCADRDKRLITIGTMTSEIAHEIKNAIIAIGGLAGLVKKRYPGAREIDIIQTEAYRLERLVKSINSFVRPDKNRGEESDALSILQKSLCLLSPEIKKRNIKIDLNLCQDTGAFDFDSDALMEVFVNLIRNAIEALSPRGKLEIRSYIKDGSLAIDFKNRMESKRVDDPENIFRPIDQGGRSIGLPISRKIIKNLGGRLFFRQIGDYALFSITFPLKHYERGDNQEKLNQEQINDKKEA